MSAKRRKNWTAGATQPTILGYTCSSITSRATLTCLLSVDGFSVRGQYDCVTGWRGCVVLSFCCPLGLRKRKQKLGQHDDVRCCVGRNADHIWMIWKGVGIWISMFSRCEFLHCVSSQCRFGRGGTALAGFFSANPKLHLKWRKSLNRVSSRAVGPRR